jgi:dienelactone hydrolase
MHGGFFAFGSKESPTIVTLATEFASRGYVTASINYRLLEKRAPAPGESFTIVPERVPSWLLDFLAPQGVTLQQYADTIAAAVEDQATAVNWLADNAANYGLSPNKIAVGGYSAGAVSSLLLGVDAVDAVSANVGAVFSMAGGLFGLEPAVDVSDPGIYILHGTADATVPYSEALFLKDALTDASVPFASLEVSGANHDADPLLGAFFASPVPAFQFLIDQINANAVVTLDGDFNEDGTVDAADYTVWRNGLGSIFTPSDYGVWKANFGQTEGAGSASDSATSIPGPIGGSSATVPEPTTVILFTLGLTLASSIASRPYLIRPLSSSCLPPEHALD